MVHPHWQNRHDEDALTRAIIALAGEYGRYGYRRITAKLREAGWRAGKDRVERIWRREGLKVPKKQKPRGRLWLNDGSCVRLRPERPNHVELRFREREDARWKDGADAEPDRGVHAEMPGDPSASSDRQRACDRGAGDAMVEHGIPEHIRSDEGPEFVANELRQRLAPAGAKTHHIEAGSPWENGYCGSPTRSCGISS